MAITVLFTDLRIYPSQLEKYSVKWEPNMTAREVIKDCLGEMKTQVIEKDLNDNNQEITVVWWHKPSGETSEVGGAGTIQWSIDDDSVLSIDLLHKCAIIGKCATKQSNI
jgi:hypothetical protein